MLLPKLNRIRTAKTEINTFRGINQSVNTGFSKVNSKSSSIYTEFKNMKNMSCEDYPCISTREKKMYINNNDNIASNIIIINNKIIYITDENKISINGNKYEISDLISKNHFIIYLNSNIYIFPDCYKFSLKNYKSENLIKYYYKESFTPETQFQTHDYAYRGNIVKNMSVVPNSVMGHLCTKFNFLDDEMQKDDNNQIYSDIQSDCFCEKIYESDKVSVQSKLYMVTQRYKNTAYYGDTKLIFKEVPSNYVSIVQPKIGTVFNTGDYVRIRNVKKEATGTNYDNISNDRTFADKLNNKVFKILYQTEDKITISCELNCSVSYIGSMFIANEVPSMDLMIENNNRIWGCSSKNNEIYASKLGDPTQWLAYADGLSTDSYALSLGTDGDFTGITTINSAILFFKENYIHKIYGTKPSNYCLTTYNAPGVERGSSKSLVWINGVLYYKSVLGICAYSPGGVPVVISDEAFGENKYKNAVAGRHRNKYYVSLQNIETEKYELYVYDTENGIWDKEDNTQFLDTFTYNENLYFIDGKTNYIGCISDNNNLLSEINTEQYTEDRIDWMCETGNLYDNDLNTKFISQIQLLLELDNGTDVTVEIRTKNNESYKKIKEIHSTMKRAINIPFVTKRSEFLQIRISGKGKARLYQIDIKYSGGSENRGKLYNI